MQSKSRVLFIMMICIGYLGIVSAQYPVDFDSTKWHDTFCYGDEVCLVGNFNGITGDDIVAFVRSSTGTDNDGNVWVALAGGDGFYNERVWHENFCFGDEVCAVGDFNGDGRDDIIAFVRSSTGTDNDGNVWVALSDGQGFVDARIWHDSFCYSLEACLIGDFNGDGKDDIAAATGPVADGNQADDVWVALSDGSAFVETRVWGAVTGCEFRDDSYSCMTGDFDGDNDDDIVSHDWESDRLWVIASEVNRFEGEQIWLNLRASAYNGNYPHLCDYPGQTCQTGDYNADGYDDIFTFARKTISGAHDAVFINQSYGIPESLNREENTGFEIGAAHVVDAFCIEDAVCQVGDINDDGLVDVIVFYRSIYPNDTLVGDVWVAINRSNR